MNNSNDQNILQTFKRKKVYFERQAYDKLCGVHCLNSLLQGPFFDPIFMSEIAQKLDDMEKQLLGEDSYKAFGNVDDDGNYNIQVLQEALKTQEVELVPLKKNEAEKLLIESYDTLNAFIFNSTTHWFSIRKIDNIWFNLNSCNSLPGPQIISEFYLSAFIKGTEELGFSNFLVNNLKALPELDSPIYKNLNQNMMLVDISLIVSNKPKKINMGDCDDAQLEKVLEMSKKEYEHQSNNKDKFNENKINQDQGYLIDDEYIPDSIQNEIEDDDLKIAMELSLVELIENLKISLPEEPSESEPNAINISIKEGNRTFERRFKKTDKIKDLKNYLTIKIRTFNDFEISDNYSKKLYSNDNLTFEESGILTNCVLNAKMLQ